MDLKYLICVHQYLKKMRPPPRFCVSDLESTLDICPLGSALYHIPVVMVATITSLEVKAGKAWVMHQKACLLPKA